MNEEISTVIKNIEDQLLEPLHNAVDSLFKTSWLPSHDLSHSVRVWSYAKELILELNNHRYKIPPALIEECIVACYFHDTGMIENTGWKHGALSETFCKNFLISHYGSLSGHKTTLESIRYHDDKTYQNKSLLDLIHVHTILSIADDLDASGVIGIYRYIEIFLIREQRIQELPQLVIKNLENRFSHFKKHCANLTQLYSKYKKAFEKSLIFFEEMKSAIGLNHDSYTVEVAYLIQNFVINSGIHPLSISDHLSPNVSEPTRSFFQNLSQELSGNLPG